METCSPGQAPPIGPLVGRAEVADPYQASPSTAVFAGLQASASGPALVPFRQPSAPVALVTAQAPNSEQVRAAGALQVPHVVGRPVLPVLAKEGLPPATPKPHGAPRTPVKQLPKSVPSKPAVEAGAHARQQLLEAKRAAPPLQDGVPLPASPGPPNVSAALPAQNQPQSFLIHDDGDAEVPPSPELGKLE